MDFTGPSFSNIVWKQIPSPLGGVYASIAQLAEHFIGKEEVSSPNLLRSSIGGYANF